MAQTAQPDYSSDPSLVDSDHFEVALKPDTTEIRLHGALDFSLHESLDAVAGLAIDFGSPVVVNLTDVTFIDSTGLAFLARIAAAGRERGWVSAVVDGKPQEATHLMGAAAVLDSPEGDPPGP